MVIASPPPTRGDHMTIQQAGVLFHEGRLREAIAAAGEAVRRDTTSAAARLLLAELLLFDGNLERADTMLQTASNVDPSTALVVAEFRQLIRAALARREVAAEGRAPAFLGEPTVSQTHLLRARVALRSGDDAGAAEAVAAAEQARPAQAGQSGDFAFDDFRDADDLWTGTLEVLTSTGKYFWIPAERVVSLEFHSPKRPRDLFWRRCTMEVRDGPEGDVYMPALYETAPEADDRLRLGRETKWTDTAPVRGLGQRLFLIGEEGFPITRLSTMHFA
jgi:type VI secretion system protein ImpE